MQTIITNNSNDLILNCCDVVLLETLVEEIKKIESVLNIKVWDYKFHRYNEYSFIDPIKKKIRFKYLIEYDFDTATKTIAHELRHQFQIEVINNQKQHPDKELWTDAYIELKTSNSNDEKLFNLLEIDAAAFAMHYLNKYHNSKINYKNKKFNRIVKQYIKDNF